MSQTMIFVGLVAGVALFGRLVATITYRVEPEMKGDPDRWLAFFAIGVMLAFGLFVSVGSVLMLWTIAGEMSR